MPDKYVGTVIWFNAKKGIGFITQDNKPDMFVHWSDIECEEFKTLTKGDKVAYSIGANNRGQPKAINVVVINAEEK